MVVAGGQRSGRGIRAELAPGTAVAVRIDQPRQQRLPPCPPCRGLRILPLPRKPRSLTRKHDPLAIDHHRAIGEDREWHDEAARQQHACVGAHVGTIDLVRGRRLFESASPLSEQARPHIIDAHERVIVRGGDGKCRDAPWPYRRRSFIIRLPVPAMLVANHRGRSRPGPHRRDRSGGLAQRLRCGRSRAREVLPGDRPLISDPGTERRGC